MEEGSFAREIESHLELQRRNSRLEQSMPLSGYRERIEHDGPEPDPSTEAVVDAAPWDDPDSWWNVREAVPGELDWQA
jgi:hypothetical protein